MSLFEDAFLANRKYYVREFNEQSQKSELREVSPEWEYYQPSESGKFRDFFGNNYFKRTGKYEYARNHTCVNPLDVAIRDLYRNRYNLKPRVMYLDIETRVGTVQHGFPSP